MEEVNQSQEDEVEEQKVEKSPNASIIKEVSETDSKHHSNRPSNSSKNTKTSKMKPTNSQSPHHSKDTITKQDSSIEA